jgi:hypothetical protein
MSVFRMMMALGMSIDNDYDSTCVSILLFLADLPGYQRVNDDAMPSVRSASRTARRPGTKQTSLSRAPSFSTCPEDGQYQS